MSETNTNAAVALEAATVVSENVNAANDAASVKPIVGSVEETVKHLLKDTNNKVIVTTITSLNCEVKASKDGQAEYINAWLTIDNPLIGAQSMPDGTHRMGMLGTFQTPFNSLLLAMRKNTFYGRYVKYIEEAAEIDAASIYLAGVPIKVFCQFVAAGEQAGNPFTRKMNEYAVENYDRYIYHIVGIGECKDVITLQSYMELNKQIAADAREMLLKKRAAKASLANIMNSVNAVPQVAEIPF